MANIPGDLQQLWKDATRSTLPFNDRGFVPFQFSSKMTQVNVSEFGGLVPSNPLSTMVNEAYAWFEMWINPQKISLSRALIQKLLHTAGSVVTFHYRPDVMKMQVSGAVGWLAINPQRDKDTRSLGFGNLTKAKQFSDVWDKNRVSPDPAKRNSPRIFLKRIRDIAEEAMYFIDLTGFEHYNTKYIKIYTKQYPEGMICEGYFTKFDVPEEGEDSQTINYNFDFTVESIYSVSSQTEMVGMFGTNRKFAQKTLSPLPGII